MCMHTRHQSVLWFMTGTIYPITYRGERKITNRTHLACASPIFSSSSVSRMTSKASDLLKTKATRFTMPCPALVIRLSLIKTFQRRSSIRRLRRSLADFVRDLSPSYFQYRFLIPYETFQNLLSIMRPELELYDTQSLRSSGGIFKPDVWLFVLLRMLSGASYLDTMNLFSLVPRLSTL